MQSVLSFIESRRRRLSDHDFYQWLRSHETPLERRMLFAPIMASFVLSHRELNLRFLPFPGATERLRGGINAKALADANHAALFLEDWRSLGLDQRLGWRASETLWWLFLAERTEPFRAFAVDFAQLALADLDDPLLRLAHTTAGEACASTFFDALAPVANDAGRVLGRSFRYFGESGATRLPACSPYAERRLEDLRLSVETRAQAVRLAARVFDISFAMHDLFLDYARTIVTTAHLPHPPTTKPPSYRLIPNGARRWRNAQPRGMHLDVQRTLLARKARTAAHPFFAWLRAAPLSALARLRRLVPLWAFDILSHRNLNLHALRVRAPASAIDHALNAWVDRLATHSTLFLNDWRALRLDDALEWTASETMAFLFLDPKTELRRTSLARLTTLALRHERPVLRFWLLEALEASREALLAATRPLALEVESHHPVRLDYFADRHDLVDVSGRTHWEGRYAFKGEPLTGADRDQAAAMVETVFDAVDGHLDGALVVARDNLLAVRTQQQQQQHRRRRLISDREALEAPLIAGARPVNAAVGASLR
jgi:hypothetical protein